MILVPGRQEINKATLVSLLVHQLYLGVKGHHCHPFRTQHQLYSISGFDCIDCITLCCLSALLQHISAVCLWFQDIIYSLLFSFWTAYHPETPWSLIFKQTFLYYPPACLYWWKRAFQNGMWNLNCSLWV